MYNAVGGSTIHWSAHFPRFHPSDFKVRTLDEVAEDWPLSYEQLEPYYDRNDEIMGIAGVAGDPAFPTSTCLAAIKWQGRERLRRLQGRYRRNLVGRK